MSSSSLFCGYRLPTKRLNPIARVLLIARNDDDNIWSKLGEIALLKQIWEYCMDFNRHVFNAFINDKEIGLVYRFPSQSYKWPYKVKRIRFPEPTGININMMPFICKEYDFEETKLPDYVEPYFELIVQCLGCESQYRQEATPRIAFLTINESTVKKGNSQRRPGLHVENAGTIELRPEDLSDEEKESASAGATMRCMQSKGSGKIERMPVTQYGPFGGGFTTSEKNVPRDGIYMASNVDNSCRAWNCKIVANKENDGQETIGRYGDIEHLRMHLEEREIETVLFQANTLYWMTDRTPHEVLPMKQDTYRQYFRLVTWNVAAWHEQHCTPNPHGVMPDPKVTRVIKSSKFGN